MYVASTHYARFLRAGELPGQWHGPSFVHVHMISYAWDRGHGTFHDRSRSDSISKRPRRWERRKEKGDGLERAEDEGETVTWTLNGNGDEESALARERYQCWRRELRNQRRSSSVEM